MEVKYQTNALNSQCFKRFQEETDTTTAKYTDLLNNILNQRGILTFNN